MGYYTTAQICLNGHYMTRKYEKGAERRKEYCPRCGAPTITHCPQCDTSIQGLFVEGPNISGGGSPPPAYCYNCGHPFPWLESRLQAIRELTLEAEKISQEEKDRLIESLPDLVNETPRTPLAISRWKTGLGKLGGYTVQAIRDILVDVASEAIKKSLFPGS